MTTESKSAHVYSADADATVTVARRRRLTNTYYLFLFAYAAAQVAMMAMLSFSEPIELSALCLVCAFGSLGGAAWCAAERERLAGGGQP